MKSVVLILCFLLHGCAGTFTEPVPLGAKAATQTDLSPWLGLGVPHKCTGYLEKFSVCSDHGIYETWALHSQKPKFAFEVDVRNCQEEAQEYRDSRVVVSGILIDRGRDHRPLFVARHIEPSDPLEVVRGQWRPVHAKIRYDPIPCEYHDAVRSSHWLLP